MRLLLVRPNWVTRRMILPPIGLAYISAAAKKEGHECIVHDSWLLNEEPFEAAALIPWDIDIIGVQVYQNTVQWTKELFGWLRIIGSKAKLIIGGPYATALKEQARKEMGADCAVSGEFETDITENLEAIMDGATLIDWTKWIDVNEHPFPDWDSMPLPEYWKYYYSPGAPILGKRIGFIQRTRGCPHKCTFCASGGIIMGKKVRFRELSNVIQEVEYLKKRWDIDELWFQDDDVTINRTLGLELFKALVPYKLRIRLQMGIRTDHLDDEMIVWMKKAGVYYAGIGIESGSPKILKVIKKGLNQQKVIDGIAILDRYGIQVMGFFMFGLNTETRTDMEETVQWALKTKLHQAQFSVYIPYPGSEDYKNNVKSLLPQTELYKIQRNAFRRFYLRPRILWNILIHLHWSQIKGLLEHPWLRRWWRVK